MKRFILIFGVLILFLIPTIIKEEAEEVIYFSASSKVSDFLDRELRVTIGNWANKAENKFHNIRWQRNQNTPAVNATEQEVIRMEVHPSDPVSLKVQCHVGFPLPAGILITPCRKC